MFDVEYSVFFNIFDISVLIVILISSIFALKNGLIKSVLNLLKWIGIVFLIKFSFAPLTPLFGKLGFIGNSKTLSDVIIFLSVFVCSFILLSTFNRFAIGIIQPKKSGFSDYLFGTIFGILRGYIVVVLIFSLITSYVPYSSWWDFLSNGKLIYLIQKGEEKIDIIPDILEEANDYVT